MRSRAMRTASSAVALLIVGAAAAFLMYSERQISGRLQAFHAFDQRARDVAGEVSAMRAAQQAYVAAGQGVDFWIPEVATLLATAEGSIEELRQSAMSPDARRAAADAAASVAEFGDADNRARDYLQSGEQLMAADVVFAEGGETATTAGHQIETARLAEQQAFDAFEAERRRWQAYALSGTAVCALLIVGLLVPKGSSASADVPAAAVQDAEPATAGLRLRDASPSSVPAAEARPRDAVPALRQAALLCTDLGRVTDIDDLTRLLGRATEVMDASGLVVWLGNVGGVDLRPVLAYGYPPEALAQMPAVPRSADNAAAAAYRTGRFQIVMARPGAPGTLGTLRTTSGAVVAPLLSPEGCIGALAAEMKGGSETSDSAQALAAIFAAQLTSVLASSVAAGEPDASVTRTAAG